MMSKTTMMIDNTTVTPTKAPHPLSGTLEPPVAAWFCKNIEVGYTNRSRLHKQGIQGWPSLVPSLPDLFNAHEKIWETVDEARDGPDVP